MGTTLEITCTHCGIVFEASDGGGFAFHLLHCERCGREHAVQEQEMGTAFTEDRPAVDTWMAANVPPCRCGGRFTFDAKARCPKCKSDDWDDSNATVEVDYD